MVQKEDTFSALTLSWFRRCKEGTCSSFFCNSATRARMDWEELSVIVRLSALLPVRWSTCLAQVIFRCFRLSFSPSFTLFFFLVLFFTCWLHSIAFFFFFLISPPAMLDLLSSTLVSNCHCTLCCTLLLFLYYLHPRLFYDIPDTQYLCYVYCSYTALN